MIHNRPIPDRRLRRRPPHYFLRLRETAYGYLPEDIKRAQDLAANLITAAFGLIGISIFAATSVFDKIDHGALTWGYGLTAIAIALFVASIVIGGLAAMNPLQRFLLNICDWQMALGVSGIIVLMAGAWVFVFHAKPDSVQGQLATLQTQVNSVQSRLNMTIDDIKTLNTKFDVRADTVGITDQYRGHRGSNKSSIKLPTK